MRVIPGISWGQFLPEEGAVAQAGGASHGHAASLYSVSPRDGKSDDYFSARLQKSSYGGHPQFDKRPTDP
jgi:hypothetical protein